MAFSKATRRTAGVIPALVALVLAGCATPPPPRPVPPPPPAPPSPTVFSYPAQGQTPQQMDRDRFECNMWAVQQTGFDPSQVSPPPQRRLVVVPGGPPPGANVAAGAMTGAVVGAAVSNPWYAGQGALIGAVGGAIVGGIIDSQRAHQVQAQQAQLDATVNSRDPVYERRVSDFRRAMSACLEGRGYHVR
jgi:hypothetical protein